VRNKLFLIFCLFLLTALVVTLALAQEIVPEPGETIYGIVEFDGARVYVGPDFAYRLIGELRQNTSVVVLGRRGDFFYSWDGRQWLQIEFQGGTGWVYARLIRTSIPFNSIRPTGRPLPRNDDGRVPDDFDLSHNVCDGWTGAFTQAGDFMAGDEAITVTYPALQGANVYSVIVIAPSGARTAHDSTTTTAEVLLDNLGVLEQGTYTWRVAPYWTNAPQRYNWQQICLLQTGGTFQVPVTRTPRPTRPPYWYYRTPRPTLTPPPFVP
jgi:hypothetical protein